MNMLAKLLKFVSNFALKALRHTIFSLNANFTKKISNQHFSPLAMLQPTKMNQLVGITSPPTKNCKNKKNILKQNKPQANKAFTTLTLSQVMKPVDNQLNLNLQKTAKKDRKSSLVSTSTQKSLSLVTTIIISPSKSHTTFQSL